MLLPTQQGKQEAASGSSRLLVGLALLITLCCSDVVPSAHDGALSTIITGARSPSALCQLATFAALEDVAEEEDLSWGAHAKLKRAAIEMSKPHHSRTHTETEETEAASDCGVSSHPTSEDESSSGSSAGRRRRRPHRRAQHRSANSDVTTTDATDVDDFVPVAPAVELKTSVWEQLHVSAIAQESGDAQLIRTTQQLLSNHGMYATIYRLSTRLRRLSAGYEPHDVPTMEEEQLLASPRTGIDGARFWSCSRCGQNQDEVRERCRHCRAPSTSVVKLFVGQSVKELDCSGSIVRLLQATHPHVKILRIEAHSAQGRGKGCAAIYVSAADAPEIIAQLHRNVFFDEDANTGELMAYYVYPQQQAWLQAYQEYRVGQRGGPSCLPRKCLVVEQCR